MTVETLLKVICSQKICNSGQAALSDCLCHGYLGRLSLKASFAGGGASSAEPPRPRAARSHLSAFHKGCLIPRVPPRRGWGGEKEGGAHPRCSVLMLRPLARRILAARRPAATGHAEPGCRPRLLCLPGWRPRAAILGPAAGLPPVHCGSLGPSVSAGSAART